jgi:Inosine-uridine nucleoside N-ribohydrolase
MDLIIDTDPGQDIDDLLALWFALKRPELNVRAITTVTYPTEPRARIAKRLLRLLGRTDVAVGAGMQLPMRPFSDAEMAFQKDLAKSMNHACFADPPDDPRDAPDTPDVPALIAATAGRCPDGATIACLGPYTNIAATLLRYPDIKPRIKQIFVMGGEFDLPRTEHNVDWDSAAADILLRSGIPLAFGPWSVTRQFTLPMADCAVFGASPAPAAKEIFAAINIWHPAQSWKPGPVMYDIFPILHALAPGKYYEMETRKIAIIPPGMTQSDSDGVEVSAARAIDAEAARRIFFETVLG